MKKLIFVLAIFMLFLLFGCTDNSNNQNDINNITNFSTFKEVDNSICTIDGKPVIRLYSTTWCPHCKWINETYNSTVKEYVSQGKIVAYHFELDTNDDALTQGIDGIPVSEETIFKQFSPTGSIPTFVFGCKYYRIGNGYEPVGQVSAENNQKRLDLEKAEFRKIIEELIKQVSN